MRSSLLCNSMALFSLMASLLIFGLPVTLAGYGGYGASMAAPSRLLAPQQIGQLQQTYSTQAQALSAAGLMEVTVSRTTEDRSTWARVSCRLRELIREMSRNVVARRI